MGLAVTVLVDTAREGRDHGKKMAIGALCAAGFWVIAGTALGIYFLTAGVDRGSDGEVLESGRVGARDLSVGDCLPEPPRDGNQFFIDVVPCGEPHRGEVFAVFDLRSFIAPGEPSKEIDDECLAGFTDYFGTAPADPTLEIYVMQPPDQSSFNDDPAVSCMAFVDESVTGSLKDGSE